jgi:hypothetical protein
MLKANAQSAVEAIAEALGWVRPPDEDEQEVRVDPIGSTGQTSPALIRLLATSGEWERSA